LPAEQTLKSRLIRAYGFLRREALGMLRQPRLMLTLILAPFAILLIFGLGYRTDPPPFQTLLVLPGEEAGLAAQREELSDAFGDAIELEGTTTDATEARARLRSGDVDLLIIGPADALTSIEDGERAEFVVVHSEVDPVIRSSIDLLAQLSVDELNRRVLTEIVSRAQTGSEVIEQPLEAMRETAEDLIAAVESGNQLAADETRRDLNAQIDQLEVETETSAALQSTVGNALGTGSEDPFGSLKSDLQATATEGGALEAARGLENRLDELESRFGQLQEVEPGVFVTPFASEVQDIADLPGTPALFYAPGVLMILIQHLALTFAALSLVRERQLGLTELFQASPLAPGEILIGKFIAFLTASVVIAATLIGAILVFGVTIRGSVLYLALTVVLVIMASLGLGFVISSVAQTDSQAVQYAMMVLLFSIFFTGLILPLDQLIPPVRALSFLAPGTYGISALHDVMFRGLRPDLTVLIGLGAYALVMFGASWWVMRRHVTRFAT
jgi:ABC-2 type transport system permease protein